jgi:hypothetical protein
VSIFRKLQKKPKKLQKSIDFPWFKFAFYFKAAKLALSTVFYKNLCVKSA